MAARLTGRGYRVHGFRRSDAHLPDGVDLHLIDVHDCDSLTSLSATPYRFVVVTLTPDEMTDAGYARTYVAGTRNVLDALDLGAVARALRGVT